MELINRILRKCCDKEEQLMSFNFRHLKVTAIRLSQSL